MHFLGSSDEIRSKSAVHGTARSMSSGPSTLSGTMLRQVERQCESFHRGARHQEAKPRLLATKEVNARCCGASSTSSLKETFILETSRVSI